VPPQGDPSRKSDGWASGNNF